MSGAPAQSTSWASRVEGQRGAQQVRQALLPGDPPDEHHRRPVRVDAVRAPARRCRGRAGTPRCRCRCAPRAPGPGRRRVAAQHVVAHARRHRDDRVGGLDRGLLGPRRQRVAAAELLGLPRPQRLQAVRAHHVRHAVQQLGQVAGHVGVPGVRVHQVRALAAGDHRQVGARGRAARGWPSASAAGHAVRRDARLVPRRAHAVHPHVDQTAQLPGEVLDVDPGAAVDLGRVLPGEQVDAHRTMIALATAPAASVPER